MSEGSAPRLDLTTIDFLRRTQPANQPSILLKLVSSYKRNTQEIFELLLCTIENQQLDQAAIWAHKLKGSSSMIGAHQLSNLAREFEQQCKSGEGGLTERYEELLLENTRVVEELNGLAH